MNIFNIQNEYRKLAYELVECEGELSQDTETALHINLEQLEQKGIQYGYVVKELESEVHQIDIEIKRLQALKSQRTKAVDRLKDTLKQAMELYEITELKTATLKINFRKSESVEILDVDLLPAAFFNTKTVTTVDKVSIKEAIKEGRVISGAILQQNNNLQIK